MGNRKVIATMFFSDGSTITIFCRCDDNSTEGRVDAQGYFLDILARVIRSGNVFCILPPPYYAQIGDSLVDCLRLDDLRAVRRTDMAIGRAWI